jgi:succinate dehydrogenase/fumarate reductase flavoprotein subunit
VHGNEVVDIDLLIIGSECAGAKAAIEARKHGVKVIVVTKGKVAKSGATLTVSPLNSGNGLNELSLGL